MKKSPPPKGFSLIEALVAIFVTSVLVFIFAGISYFINLGSQIKNTILAYNIAQEQIEALRNLNYGALINQSEGDFMNVVYNRGNFRVVEKDGSRVYELPGSSESGLTGLALLPFGEMADYTLEVDIMIDPSSPVNWQAGFFFRIKDLKNFYRLSFDSGNLRIHKSVNGTETQLFTTSLPLDTGHWNTYKLVVSANNFEVYRNSIQVATLTDSDNSITQGKIAFFGFNGVQAYLDNVKIDGELVSNGDFEAGPLNKTAENWEWLSIHELPQGQGKLTIEDYGDENIKNVHAIVEWHDGKRTRAINLQTLISKYGLHN